MREPCPCRDPGFDVLRYLTAALCFGTLVMPWVYWRRVRRARRLTVVLAGYLVPMAAVAVTVTLMAID